EIQRSRDHRRGDTLHQGAPHARHLEAVDRADRVPVHAWALTRFTKISSSELCRVATSTYSRPLAATRASTSATPGCAPAASKLNTRLAPSSARRTGRSASAAGGAASGA